MDGPEELQPGPFGWNNLESKDVASGFILSIDIEWHSGMGFSNTDERNHPLLPSQQEGCNSDPRFYQSVVVVHNEATGERKYWKMKGIVPPTLHVNVGDDGPVTVYILLVPTPPTDYVASHFFTGTADIDNHQYVLLSGVPRYGYRYKVAVSASGPSLGAIPTPPTDKVSGIVKFDDGSGLWSVKCTCIANLLITTGNDLPAYFEPTIDGVQPSTLLPVTPVGFYQRKSAWL